MPGTSSTTPPQGRCPSAKRRANTHAQRWKPHREYASISPIGWCVRRKTFMVASSMVCRTGFARAVGTTSCTSVGTPSAQARGSGQELDDVAVPYDRKSRQGSHPQTLMTWTWLQRMTSQLIHQSGAGRGATERYSLKSHASVNISNIDLCSLILRCRPAGPR